MAIKDGDIELIRALLKEQKRINNGESKRPSLPQSTLSNVGTGVFNKYQFGFKTRAVSLARGGKEGNNAFTKDSGLSSGYYFDVNSFLNNDPTWEVTQQFIMAGEMHESSLNDYVWLMTRRGNVDLLTSRNKKDGPTLIQRLFDNMGYGFNRYHHLALEKDIEGKINKMSMLKKPHTNKGICPLHIACINPDITVLRKFYSANPDYSAADMDQRKLIHYAAANPTDVALKFLVSKGIPINDKDNQNTTPLMIACQLGRVDNVKFLVQEQSKQIEDLDQNDEDYHLMKTSSDFINTYGPYHTYPIHYAVESGSFECVKALVDGAKGNINLEVRNTAGQTPLAFACMHGYYEIAKYLLDKGASVHETKKTKKNALIIAAQNGHIHIVSLLLRYGIHPDMPDSSGNTACHYAAGYGWLNVLRFLISNGADPDFKNEWNSTPAMIAMLKNHFGCLDYLMELENVDKSMVDNEGRTVISQLCQRYSKDTLEQIMYMDKFKQLDYNMKDANGWTCLHFLVANTIADHEVQQEVNKQLQKKKAELEKKHGRSVSQDPAPAFNNFTHKRNASKPRPVKMARKAMPSRNFAAAKTSAFGMNQNDDEDDDNPDTFKAYFEYSNIKHREMFKKTRIELENQLIECADYLYKKGVTKDSITFDGHTMFELALSNSNLILAQWLFDKGISSISKDDFVKEEAQNAYNQVSFLFSLNRYMAEIDYEPIFKLLIKELDKETLRYLLDQRSNEMNPIIYLVKNPPYKNYNYSEKVVERENKIYQKHLDLLLEMAKECDFDVGVQMRFNKQNAYQYPNITNEKLDAMFEEVNEAKYDKRVNGFGLFDLSMNTDPVYVQDTCTLNTYAMGDVKSNLLHSLIAQATDESAILS